MRLRTLAGLVVMVTVVSQACSGGPEAVAGEARIPWVGSLESARERAASERKLVMVQFYATWCGWCRRLDTRTLADERVVRALEAVVPVRLDAEGEGRAEASRMGVSGFPVTVFLTPDGREVGRISGYLDAEPFLQELAGILARR